VAVMPEVPVRAAVARLDAVLDGLDEAAARGPSALPGWSRGHVLTHLENFSRALTRQVDEGLAGRSIDMYDGGRPARDAAIEAGAGRPAEELRAGVRTAAADLLRAWDEVGPDDWRRPVRHRDGTIHDTLYTGWREFEVHRVDLALGPTAVDWSPEFCLHLLEFLRPRTPDGIRLVLRPTDGPGWTQGTGGPHAVSGRLTDLTAWMAGRSPQGTIDGELPELAPWP
jgi:maleylpyruvate isomerase